MVNQEIGRLEEVPLREVWPNEPRDFTPWLARHLDQLGEALHLNLVPVQEEGDVGSFRVDIVAREDNGPAVIENWLEVSDHDHVGKLVTYAAGRDARTLILVAREFKDEHRAALDWLNQWTSEDIAVYGVEVRSVRIGDSLPAPVFTPVVVPNAWTRESRQVASMNSSATQYRTFWAPLREYMRDRGISLNTRRGDASMQSFKSVPPVSGILYYLSFAGDSEAEVQFYIDTDNSTYNKTLFDQLQGHKDDIEAAVGTTLQWDRREENRASMIRVRRPGSLNDPHDQLNETRDWMIETLVNLKGAIDPLFSTYQDSLKAKDSGGTEGSPSRDSVD